MAQAYSNPARAADPHALPDIEVFFLDPQEAATMSNELDDDSEMEAGWYWWACFPGCMPDSEPEGPYATEAEALAAAQDID